MKTLSRFIAISALTLCFLTFNAFADCGEQTNGTKCLVSNPDTPVITKTESKRPISIEKQIADFFRGIFGGIFG
ncbi:MAG: hypothetical protein R2684_09140 [Pyrinomonadaceae bacterium]